MTYAIIITSDPAATRLLSVLVTETGRVYIDSEWVDGSVSVDSSGSIDDVVPGAAVSIRHGEWTTLLRVHSTVRGRLSTDPTVAGAGIAPVAGGIAVLVDEDGAWTLGPHPVKVPTPPAPMLEVESVNRIATATHTRATVAFEPETQSVFIITDDEWWEPTHSLQRTRVRRIEQLRDRGGPPQRIRARDIAAGDTLQLTGLDGTSRLVDGVVRAARGRLVDAPTNPNRIYLAVDEKYAAEIADGKVAELIGDRPGSSEAIDLVAAVPGAVDVIQLDVAPPPRVVRDPEGAAAGGGYDHHYGAHACRADDTPCPYWAWVEDYVDGRSSREYLEDHPQLLAVAGLVDLADPDEVPNRGLRLIDREGRDARVLGAIVSQLGRDGGAPVWMEESDT